MMKLKKLIINADDFGHTIGVSHGIIEAFKKGVVTSTTALAVSKHFPESMKLATLTCPELPIGLHLTLTLKKAKPILPKELIPSLTDDDGFFWHQSVFAEKVNPEEVYLEWEAQILTFLESGRRPTHIDSHHNAYGKNEALMSVMLKLAKTYNFPIRNPSRSVATKPLVALCQGVNMPQQMLSDFYDEGVSLATFESLLDIIQNSEDEIFEINVHPAFLDADLMAYSSYTHKRIEELQILTSFEIKEAIATRHIRLCSYDIFK